MGSSKRARAIHFSRPAPTPLNGCADDVCDTPATTSNQAMHKQSLDEPDKFWGDAARSTLKWFRDFDRVSQGGFEAGDVAWFMGGQLNACYNCIDQHLPQRAKQVGCWLRAPYIGTNHRGGINPSSCV